jgi:EAL domain-containing protein (putative c-di-GMP-specific phosphodiesterase class I)
LTIAVNVSARQFRQADFVARVKQTLETSRANPARLKLELTESLVLENVKDTIEKIRAIKQLGVSFSMDDFGTGYSSLAYLTQLPIDQLKIDRSFIRSLPGQKRDEMIARTIISMGGGLDMHVIAEGVETEEQLQFLEAHGCQAYQGFLFSRPLPIEALMAFLSLHASNRRSLAP